MWSAALVFSVCGLAYGLSRVDPLVSTKAGLIRGLTTENGYAKFLGVPYALVNKNNPFGPSIPHPGFENIYEAYETRECPQVSNIATIIGTLDCLNMNIYVPNAADSQNLLPVMVWIHGGAFVRGSAHQEGSNPHSLLKNDVIVVAINYRVGVYGFMCLDHPEISGNQGLKDQVLALRWINENIEAFGGNARQITVFGESAGGMSINLHLLSSYETLFQRAIIQSGPGSGPLLPMTLDNTYPIRLASLLNFNTTDVNAALVHLSSIDALELVQAANDLQMSSFSITPLTLPCVELEIEGVEHFLTEHPKNIITSKARTTPVIIGHNNEEASYIYASMNGEYFESYNFEDSLSIAFEFGDDFNAAADAVRHFYIGDEKITENVKWSISDFSTDFEFGHPTQRMAEQLLNAGANTVYRYVFSYTGSRNLMSVMMNLNLTGAAHADELGYLFDLDALFSGEVTPEDQLVFDRMTTLWTNFAKYGDPTPVTSDLLPVKWESITTMAQPYLEIGSDLSLRSRPNHERMAFWDLFYKVYGNYQI